MRRLSEIVPLSQHRQSLWRCTSLALRGCTTSSCAATPSLSLDGSHVASLRSSELAPRRANVSITTKTSLLAARGERMAARHRNRFLRAVRRHDSVIFPLPAVMDSSDFAAFLRTRTDVHLRRHLQSLLASNSLQPRSHEVAGMSRRSPRGAAVGASAMDDEVKQLNALLRVTEKDVQSYVWDVKQLKADNLGSCLIPYQYMCNFILQRLSPTLRSIAVRQLREQERETDDSGRSNGDVCSAREITLMQWVEVDVFGDRTLMTHGERRVPTFLLTGHTRHGVTTLLDALRNQDEEHFGHASRQDRAAVVGADGGDEWVGLGELEQERGLRRTESVRAFTIRLSVGLHSDRYDASLTAAASSIEERSRAETVVVATTARGSSEAQAPKPLQSPSKIEAAAPKDHHRSYPDRVTVVEVPGHYLFAEARLYNLSACDAVILVVALDVGVAPQTAEVVKLALNVDRPVIVVFSKADVLTDVATAANKLSRAVDDLANLGLKVSLCGSASDVDSLCRVTDEDRNGRRRWLRYFARQALVDPKFKGGNTLKPELRLERDCIGLCLSVITTPRVELLQHVLRTWAQCVEPRAACDENLARVRPGGLQAFILESTKQAYDVEWSHVSSVRRQHQAESERRILALRGERERKASLQGRFARTPSLRGSLSAQLFLLVLVKSGVLMRGLSFVAEQTVGIVEDIFSFDFQRLDTATPGTAVWIVDRHHCGPCPGAGIHVFSLPTHEHACRVSEHRRILQWYIQTLPKYTNLLRPRWQPSDFRHVGEYGQSEALTVSLGSKLLYGDEGRTLPKKTSPSQARRPPLLSVGSSADPSRIDSAPPHGDDGESEMATDSPPWPPVATEDEDLRATLHEQHSKQVSAEKSLGGFFTRQTQLALNAQERDLYREDTESGRRRALTNATWVTLRPLAFPSNEEDFMKWMNSCLHAGVLLRVNSWYAGRILMREIPRLCTRRVVLQIPVVKLGVLTLEDFAATKNVGRIVVCYRVPEHRDTTLDRLLEAHQVQLVQRNDLVELLEDLKEIVVALHKKHFADDVEGEIKRMQRGKLPVYRTVAAPPSPAGEQRRDDEDGEDVEDTRRSPADPFLASLLRAGTGMTERRDMALKRRQRLAKSRATSTQ